MDKLRYVKLNITQLMQNLELCKAIYENSIISKKKY